MNKVILMGRLTRDPEIRITNTERQTQVARYSIAVDRTFKREGQPDADFFNCTSLGRQAEFVEKYLHKGSKIVVVGSIQNNNYTNKDGQTVYSVQIMVDTVEFAESKNASAGNGGYGAPAEGTSAPAAPASDNGFMNIPDGIAEELPFQV